MSTLTMTALLVSKIVEAWTKCELTLTNKRALYFLILVLR